MVQSWTIITTKYMWRMTMRPHPTTPNFVKPTAIAIVNREGAPKLTPAKALTRVAMKSEVNYQIDE